MTSPVVLHAARELGMLRNAGTPYYVTLVADTLFDNEPVVVDAVRNGARRKVAEAAGVDPNLIAVMDFRAAYLQAVIARGALTNASLRHRGEAPHPPDMGALLATAYVPLLRHPLTPGYHPAGARRSRHLRAVPPEETP